MHCITSIIYLTRASLHCQLSPQILLKLKRYIYVFLYLIRCLHLYEYDETSHFVKWQYTVTHRHTHAAFELMFVAVIAMIVVENIFSYSRRVIWCNKRQCAREKTEQSGNVQENAEKTYYCFFFAIRSSFLSFRAAIFCQSLSHTYSWAEQSTCTHTYLC